MTAALRDLPAPEPALGMSVYEAERERALAFDPRRQTNFELYQAAERRSAKVDYLPIKLDIENASRCNFKCTMCMVSDWAKGQRAGDMSLADFKHLIDQQYGLVEIKLQGIGEPVLQRDDFFEMIRYARSKAIWVRTTTNASLLHLKDNYKKLIDADPNEVQVSVDGADAETFEAIRRGSKFSQVIKNCELINRYCEETDRPKPTKMWTVVQERNAHQLEALVDLAAETRFSNMVFSLQLTDWGSEDWRERNDAVTVEDRLDPDQLMALVDRGEKCGVKVRFWNVTEKYNTARSENLCPWPFERSFIGSDMRVVPCCMIGNPDMCEIGATGGRDFTALWQSDAYAEFRQRHLNGNIPDICRGCYRGS